MIQILMVVSPGVSCTAKGKAQIRGVTEGVAVWLKGIIMTFLDGIILNSKGYFGGL